MNSFGNPSALVTRSVVVNVRTGCPPAGSTSVAIRCSAPLTIFEGAAAGTPAWSAHDVTGQTIRKAAHANTEREFNRLVLLIEVPEQCTACARKAKSQIAGEFDILCHRAASPPHRPRLAPSPDGRVPDHETHDSTQRLDPPLPHRRPAQRLPR